MRIIYSAPNYTSWDIVDGMLITDQLMFSQGAIIADQYNAGELISTAFVIWSFLRDDIRYNADKSHQKIKTPYRLLKSGVGDCKSYSVFTAAILRNLGYACSYMFSTDRGDEPTHVFVLAESADQSVIIDATIDSFNTLPFLVDLWTIELPMYGK